MQTDEKDGAEGLTCGAEATSRDSSYKAPSRSASAVRGVAVVGLVLLAGGVAYSFVPLYLDRGYLLGLALCVLGLTALMPGYAMSRAGGAVERYADRIRQNVDDSVNRPLVVVHGGEPRVTIKREAQQDPATARAAESLERQEAILREMYTEGLAQARASFKASIRFAVVGSSLLLVGVGLSIFFAQTSGEQYASIVAGTAGVVINLTSSVFYINSNRAQSNMVSQAANLREESRDDRRLSAARELAGAIENQGLRDTVRAKVALLLQGDNSAIGYGTQELLQREKMLLAEERSAADLKSRLLNELMRGGLIEPSDLSAPTADAIKNFTRDLGPGDQPPSGTTR